MIILQYHKRQYHIFFNTAPFDEYESYEKEKVLVFYWNMYSIVYLKMIVEII